MSWRSTDFSRFADGSQRRVLFTLVG